jgi:hypothetical protein
VGLAWEKSDQPVLIDVTAIVDVYWIRSSENGHYRKRARPAGMPAALSLESGSITSDDQEGKVFLTTLVVFLRCKFQEENPFVRFLAGRELFHLLCSPPQSLQRLIEIASESVVLSRSILSWRPNVLGSRVLKNPATSVANTLSSLPHGRR